MSCMILMHIVRWKPIVEYDDVFEEIWKSPEKIPSKHSYRYLRDAPITEHAVKKLLVRLQEKVFRIFVTSLLKRSPVAFWNTIPVIDQVPWDMLKMYLLGSSLILHPDESPGEISHGTPSHVLQEMKTLLSTYFLNNHFYAIIKTFSEGILLLPILSQDEEYPSAKFCLEGIGRLPSPMSDFWRSPAANEGKKRLNVLHSYARFALDLFSKHSVLNGFYAAQTNVGLEDPKSRTLGSEFEGMVAICISLILKFDEISAHLLSLKSDNSQQLSHVALFELCQWLNSTTLQAMDWTKRHLIKPQLWHHIPLLLNCYPSSQLEVSIIPLPPKLPKQLRDTPPKTGAMFRAAKRPPSGIQPRPNSGRSFAVLPALPPIGLIPQTEPGTETSDELFKKHTPPDPKAREVEAKDNENYEEPAPVEINFAERNRNRNYLNTVNSVLRSQRNYLEQFKRELHKNNPSNMSQLRARSATFDIGTTPLSILELDRWSKSAQQLSWESGEAALDGSISLFLRQHGVKTIADLQKRIADTNGRNSEFFTSLRSILKEHVQYLYTFSRFFA
ncbi:hypothetical protein BJ742DRAFT_886092 [Cladochytrium replicatum]|nr:hypothetical protein BJ742DRAFT_886092 [Cladochytrium replicatum]